MGAAAGSVRPEPAPGEVLDDHDRVERELGRGGMGVVFAGRNPRTGKQVAIKWMSVPAGRSSLL